MGRTWIQGFDEIVALFDNYRAADKRLNRLAEQLSSICIRETSYISPDPKGGASEVPELQRYVEQREAKRDELMKQLLRVSEQFDEVIQMANLLTGIEHQVVDLYYLRGKPMHRVAMDLNYSVRACWDIRDRAFYGLAKHKNGTA